MASLCSLCSQKLALVWILSIPSHFLAILSSAHGCVCICKQYIVYSWKSEKQAQATVRKRAEISQENDPDAVRDDNVALANGWVLTGDYQSIWKGCQVSHDPNTFTGIGWLSWWWFCLASQLRDLSPGLGNGSKLNTHMELDDFKAWWEKPKLHQHLAKAARI